MPHIPQGGKPRADAKALPRPIQAKNKRTYSIKEKPVSIYGWHVDPRRIMSDLGGK